VDPEFQRALTIVLIAGTVVMGIGTVVLFLAFRAAQKERSMHMGLIAGLVGFVFVCCAILFALSYAAQR
jgi:predicted cobalt transporter CbtA